MQYDQAYSFMLAKLEQELPVHLTYHNAKHSKDVIQAVEHLCDAENVRHIRGEPLF